MSSANSLAKTDSARARRLKVIEAIAIHGMTTAEAAAYARVSTRSVTRMLQSPKVRKYIASMRSSHARRLNVTREDVLEGMLTAITHAQMTNDPGVELRGWEVIAKMQGYNAPERVVHELPEDDRKRLEMLDSLPTKQLLEMAGEENIIELNAEDFKRTG